MCLPTPSKARSGHNHVPGNSRVAILNHDCEFSATSPMKRWGPCPLPESRWAGTAEPLVAATWRDHWDRTPRAGSLALAAGRAGPRTQTKCEV